jgi:hypothetical protein
MKNLNQWIPVVAALALGTQLHGAAFVGLTTGGNLITFDSASPGTIQSSTSITGLGGQTLLGIDRRPSNGLLYGVGSGGTVFSVNPFSGVATTVSTLSVSLSGSTFGFDFNPVPDRLRLVSNLDQNLRINVATGATIVDGSLAYSLSDVNAGANPNIVAAAYINNFAGALTTTLYGIDSALDTLVIQNPPNAGTLVTVGSLGVNTSALAAFEVLQSGQAFAAFTDPNELTSGLYSINLNTGAATFLGQIGGGAAIYGLTAVPEPEEYAAMGGAALVAFAVYRRRRQQAPAGK